MVQKGDERLGDEDQIERTLEDCNIKPKRGVVRKNGAVVARYGEAKEDHNQSGMSYWRTLIVLFGFGATITATLIGVLTLIQHGSLTSSAIDYLTDAFIYGFFTTVVWKYWSRDGYIPEVISYAS